jgi:hypothetical protein
MPTGSPAGRACCERAAARWHPAPSQPDCWRRISSARGGSMPGNRACSQPRRHRAVCATSAEAEASRYSSRRADPRVSVPRWAGSCLLGDVLKDAGTSLSEFADFEPFEVDVLRPDAYSPRSSFTSTRWPSSSVLTPRGRPTPAAVGTSTTSSRSSERTACSICSPTLTN